MEGVLDFSIVTASLGQLQWLRLCLASVADQAGVRCEHLVRDGGSGEEFGNIIAQFSNVHGVRETDAGMYDALNRGLTRAQGEILAWLNCDEQYLPGTLDRVRQFFARRPDVDIAFGDAILVDSGGRALSYRRIVAPEKHHTRLDHLGTLSCATFFRRSVIDRGYIFDTKWRSIGDAVWIESLLAAGIPTATIPEPLAVYTFTGSNLSASARGYAEMKAWREQTGAPCGALRLLAVLWHRLRKLRAGAYRTRHLDYAIYTLNSPQTRVHFSNPKVGFGWPGGTAPPIPGI